MELLSALPRKKNESMLIMLFVANQQLFSTRHRNLWDCSNRPSIIVGSSNSTNRKLRLIFWARRRTNYFTLSIDGTKIHLRVLKWFTEILLFVGQESDQLTQKLVIFFGQTSWICNWKGFKEVDTDTDLTANLSGNFCGVDFIIAKM